MLALPMAWYMARYTSGKMKAFFYIAVMLPMWASYIVKAYAWVLLLAKDGVAQWFLGHLGLEGGAECASDRPGDRRQHLVHLRAGTLSGVRPSRLPFMILPVQAALERIPGSLLQSDRPILAPGHDRPSAMCVLPLAIPVLPPDRFSPSR